MFGWSLRSEKEAGTTVPSLNIINYQGAGTTQNSPKIHLDPPNERTEEKHLCRDHSSHEHEVDRDPFGWLFTDQSIQDNIPMYVFCVRLNESSKSHIRFRAFGPCAPQWVAF